MEKTRWFVGEKGKDPIRDFNSPQEGESFEEKAKAVEFWLAKQIGGDLAKVYPNRDWTVDVDSRNQSIVISCPTLSSRMGYRINMRRDTIAELLPRCRRAAGEILERYNVTRGRIVDPLTLEAFPRDARGDVKNEQATSDTVEKWNHA